MMLLAQCLLVGWLLRLGGRSWWLAAGAGLLALMPLADGVSVAMALRGLWGDPSVTSLQLLLLSLAGRTPRAFVRGWVAPAVVIGLAALLYPAALGLGDFDPYRLGYQPTILVATLSLAALAAWWRGEALWLWLLAIDLAAYAAGLLESTNLWDYLLDPLLALAALILLFRHLWNSRDNRKT